MSVDIKTAYQRDHEKAVRAIEVAAEFTPELKEAGAISPASAINLLAYLITQRATIAPAQSAPQQAVPAGWKLVPIEPTEHMLSEVEEEVGGHCYSCTRWNASWDDCKRVYAAMLAAAPAADEAASKN